MGDKYIIKEENGKEVVYERGIFGDARVGELHSNFDGSKSTQNIIGPTVTVNPQGTFSMGRDASTSDGQIGRFEKHFLDQQPTFYQDTKEEPSRGSKRGNGHNCSPSDSSYSSDYSGRSNASSSRSSGKGCIALLLFGAVVVLADYGVYLERQERAQQQPAPVVYYQPTPQIPSSPVYAPPTEQTSLELTETVRGDTLIEYPKNVEAKESRTTGISGMIFPSKRLNNLGGENVVYEVKVSYMNGHEYVIPKDKYPEFYDKLSFGDGQLVYEEIWAHSYALDNIIKNCVEGDLECITREFVNMPR